MAKRTSTKAASPTGGPFIVQNPGRIPAGHTIIKNHVCAKSMKHERDPAKHVGVCNEQRWLEGEAFDPPEGFDLERFLRHRSLPGATCGDDSHENCAGPFLAAPPAPAADEEVSADG